MVVPYKESNLDKKQQVEQMFNNIAHRYDLLNSVLSMGIDTLWRKKVVSLLSATNPKLVLDMATGTADLAIASSVINEVKIKGVDISENMLAKGRVKVNDRNLSHQIELLKGDSEKILFEENSFDAATVAFGVRNFENLYAGIKELCRVIKPNGRLLVLEFSKPAKSPYKQIYNFYFQNILPLVGRILSKDNSAYTYLPDSVQAFPDGERFKKVLIECGFVDIQIYPLTFGIATIYSAQKP